MSPMLVTTSGDHGGGHGSLMDDGESSFGIINILCFTILDFLDPFPPLSNFLFVCVLCPAIRLFNLSGPDELLVYIKVDVPH